MRFRKELVGSTTAPIILSVLSRGESYGYEIARFVNLASDGALEWQEGTLYPALHKMEKDGLIASVWRDSETGRPRKYYQITESGRKALAEYRAEWDSYVGAVAKVMGNVMASVMGGMT